MHQGSVLDNLRSAFGSVSVRLLKRCVLCRPLVKHRVLQENNGTSGKGPLYFSGARLTAGMGQWDLYLAQASVLTTPYTLLDERG